MIYNVAWKSFRPATHTYMGSRLLPTLRVRFHEAESGRIFFQVSQGTLNQPEDFLLYPLWRAFRFGQCRPALLDSISNSVVNHEWPHPFSH